MGHHCINTMLVSFILAYFTLTLHGLPVYALEVVPAGCVTGVYFHDHVINGDGSLTSHINRADCKERCQVTGFKYAYFRKASNKCFCTSSDRDTPPSGKQVDGIDHEGRCKDTHASASFSSTQFPSMRVCPR
ncbi:uncharacterized protein IL334_000997 [Kwoniella shivajii]|uniref:WSC domain-containing protein n=1 Tax=Kwoniella shivajii TaxID=564305 RepID=A0ABZ1CSB3_9TREE|nr:hypothetical protein IL334_000997 [Kwoniella shivajii]